jgi:hypothetical protein
MANTAASDALKQLLEVLQKRNATGSASPQVQARVLPGQNIGSTQPQNLLNYRTPSTQKIGSPRPGMDLSQVINFISQNRQPLTIPFAPGTKTLQSRGFDESVKQNEIANQLARQAQAISAGNASRAAANQAFGQKMDIWRATGQAPEGIPGVAPGTPYGGTLAGQGGDDSKLWLEAIKLAQSDPRLSEQMHLNPFETEETLTHPIYDIKTLAQEYYSGLTGGFAPSVPQNTPAATPGLPGSNQSINLPNIVSSFGLPSISTSGLSGSVFSSLLEQLTPGIINRFRSGQSEDEIVKGVYNTFPMLKSTVSEETLRSFIRQKTAVR